MSETPQCLATQAQQMMMAGQYQSARDCLMRITEQAAQAVVIKMLLLVSEHELNRQTLPSAAEFVPMRCIDERWPSRWANPCVRCRAETMPCDGMTAKDADDKTRFQCAHEAPYSDYCAHPAALRKLEAGK